MLPPRGDAGVIRRFWKAHAAPLISALCAVSGVLAVAFFVDLNPQVESDFFFSAEDPQLQESRELAARHPGSERIIIRAGGPISSEAYSTAFCVYVLLETGTKRSDEVITAGLRWLREHQREGGDWYTRSPRRDGKDYISRAATAFALMALAEKE